MDKCNSLFQCSERLLAGWGTRESDLLDCDRGSGGVRYRLIGKAASDVYHKLARTDKAVTPHY